MFIFSKIILVTSFFIFSNGFIPTNTRNIIRLNNRLLHNAKYNDKEITFEGIIFNVNNETAIKPGYPKQANQNITVPCDPEDIESEDFLDSYRKRLFGDNIGSKRNYGFQRPIDNRNNSNPVKRIVIGLGGPDQEIVNLDDSDDEELDEIEKHLQGQLKENQEEIKRQEEEKKQEFENEMKNALGVRFFIRRGSENDENNKEDRSENFEIIKNPDYSFDQVGGYENVKAELMQSVDMLKNFEKYQKYNVRTPKGIILEGPPGNGKTLMARAFSGEVNSSFIPVSGSQFQEKYVGVGASRIRELFELAEKNLPCVIFIDEIDAVGRSRSSDDGSSSGERDQTLNQLLVALDGYKNTSGIFVVGATNRVDLLDEALIRPGRIDKKIYIGNPDAKTREKILNIHIEGKPHELDVRIENLVDMTNGLSGAQIENLLNEAMLYALRENREKMVSEDLEHILGRMLVGYQPNENAFSDDMIYRISIHEMGHAIVGLLCTDHSKLVKVCLNLWSPSSPGYTIFEQPEIDSHIYTKERLMARLKVLLSGRIAEEIFFGASITSGASKDIDEAYALAERMIVKFGMGKKTVYPYSSENSKEFIDRDIERLLESAYQAAHHTISNSQPIMEECAKLLIKNKLLLPNDIAKVIQRNHIENS